MSNELHLDPFSLQFAVKQETRQLFVSCEGNVLQPNLQSNPNFPIMRKSEVSACTHSISGHTTCRGATYCPLLVAFVCGMMNFSTLCNAQLSNLKYFAYCSSTHIPQIGSSCRYLKNPNSYRFYSHLWGYSEAWVALQARSVYQEDFCILYVFFPAATDSSILFAVCLCSFICTYSADWLSSTTHLQLQWIMF